MDQNIAHELAYDPDFEIMPAVMDMFGEWLHSNWLRLVQDNPDRYLKLVKYLNPSQLKHLIEASRNTSYADEAIKLRLLAFSSTIRNDILTECVTTRGSTALLEWYTSIAAYFSCDTGFRATTLVARLDRQHLSATLENWVIDKRCLRIIKHELDQT